MGIKGYKFSSGIEINNLGRLGMQLAMESKNGIKLIVVDIEEIESTIFI